MDLFDLDGMNENVQVDEAAALVHDDRKSLDVRRIIQPKTVTYAKYNFSKIQNLIFVHIREELQQFISSKREEINSRELITIPLFAKDYPTFRHNGNAFYYEVRELMKKESNFVSFEWQYDPAYHRELFLWMQKGVNPGSSARMKEPEKGHKIQQFSALIVDVKRCDNDPGKLIVSLNPSVLPFLLYYGKGIGSTEFDRDVSLNLSSRYSFRVYELIMEWKRDGVKKISIQEFREIVGFPDKYDVYDLRTRVLDVAREEIRLAASNVNFDYTLEYDISYGFVTGSKGKYPYNCIVFTITEQKATTELENREKRLYVLLADVAEKEKKALCEELSKQIVSRGQLKLVLSKFEYYYKKYHSGSITKVEYRNTLLKVILGITGVDLRSEEHIRNSLRASRRFKVIEDYEPQLLFSDE